MSRKFPQLLCSLIGFVLLGLYFSSHPSAVNLSQTILIQYWQILFAFALIVGVVGFVNSNVSQIRRGKDFPFRITALVGFAGMVILALAWGLKGDSPFMWMFDNVQAPMQSTVFALLAFFVASASFRGFRARSLPATVLLAAAALTLLSRSDIGDQLLPGLATVADWVRETPSMAARRAILIGIGLGSLTTSLRVLLGIERTWLGRDR